MSPRALASEFFRWRATRRNPELGLLAWLTPRLLALPPAVLVVDLFNNLNLYYSVVTEFCTVENNPTMSAGPG